MDKIPLSCNLCGISLDPTNHYGIAVVAISTERCNPDCQAAHITVDGVTSCQLLHRYCTVCMGIYIGALVAVENESEIANRNVASNPN